MKLDLTVFIWIAVTFLIFVALVYVVGIAGMIFLAGKDKKKFKEFKEKKNREWLEKEREYANRMTKRREDFYKRNKAITKELDKHFKE